MACGSKACGCMSEPRKQSPRQNPPSSPAWRERGRRVEVSDRTGAQPKGGRPRGQAATQLPLPFAWPGEEKAGAPPVAPRVFPIPPSAPFLPTLIRALRDGRLVEGFAPGPLDYADVTIFLPTRRACRLARDAFLQVLGVDAAVLPRVVPLCDIDEDELVFADMAT